MVFIGKDGLTRSPDLVSRIFDLEGLREIKPKKFCAKVEAIIKIHIFDDYK